MEKSSICSEKSDKQVKNKSPSIDNESKKSSLAGMDDNLEKNSDNQAKNKSPTIDNECCKRSSTAEKKPYKQ